MEGVDLGAEPDASTSGPVISTVGFGVQGPYMLPRYGAQRQRCRSRLQVPKQRSLHRGPSRNDRSDTVVTPEDTILEAEWDTYMRRNRMTGCIYKTPTLRDLRRQRHEQRQCIAAAMLTGKPL